MKQLLDLHYKSFFFLFLFFLHSHLVQAAPPTTAASNFSFTTISGTSISLNFTKGNGDGRIIIIRRDNPVSYTPVNGSVYTASTDYGAGTQVKTGEYVVYNGTASSLTITALSPNYIYHIAVFEYNGSGASTEFLASPLRGVANTTIAPTDGSSNVLPDVTGNSARVRFAVGNGATRMVVMKKGAPVDAVPANDTFYNLNTQIGNGNMVVFNGTGNVFDVFNLTASADYHFAIFEYNGGSQPVYQAMPPTRFSFTTHERPTVGSSNFVVEGREGDRIFLRYTLGNGYARIVVARQGQPVTAVPVDGVKYKGNLNFGGTGSSDLGGGQYVIYDGRNANESGSNSMTMTSLPRNTTYHFAIFEYDMNSSGQPVYQASNIPTVSGNTYDEPSVAAKNMIIDNITDKEARLRYTPGNGSGRIVIARRGAPVNVSPADLTNYSSNFNFGFGAMISGDNYVIADGSTTTTTVQRMQSSTEYHFAVFEYNGYLGKLYLDADPVRGQLTTAARPSFPSTSMSYSNIDGNSLKISWFNGNGKGRVIVAKKGSPVTVTSGAVGDLRDNVTYAANAVFGQGTELKQGEFVVYNDSTGTVDTKNTFTLSGLEGNTQYYFAVYEYGQLNGVLQYATASPAMPSTLLTGNSFTAKPPVTAVGSLSISAVANRTMNLSWIPGSGEMRIVVAKAGSPVDANPVDLVNYTGDAAFGNGSEIGNGNFVVYKGAGRSVNLTGLQPATTYYFAVYEANGSLAPVFQNTVVTPATLAFQTTLQKPTTAASAINFSALSATGFTINWTKGNGEKSLVIMRETSSVNTMPVDGIVYTANEAFGEGTDISTDGTKNYVVYNGTGSSVAVTGLKPGSTYFVSIFAFEETTPAGTAFLTSPSANSSKQVVAAPSAPTTALQVISSSNGVVQMVWANGSGQRRIILAKEGAEVNAVPADKTSYNANTTFGSGQQVGSGNFAVFNGISSSVTVSNLKPNRQYHFAVFEYNQFGPTILYQTANPAKVSTIQVSTLPVTWLSFNATNRGKEVLLEWKTAAEEKNKLFEIERSVDGTSFSKIGSVLAANDGQPVHTYSYIDVQPATGTIHYRIKQVDVDGNFTYSKTVQVKSEERSLLQILQNPVGGQLNIRCSEQIKGGKLEITNSSGQVVFHGIVTNQQIAIPVSHLPAGVYYLKGITKEGSDLASLSFLRH
ncbi:MAG: T9SS type A sorting domain-containing protein [Chitinophagaceae bacterium]|nr:MAG: T9SS type A sorting domain-containing protein [Chitinophagaceae bacterium]